MVQTIQIILLCCYPLFVHLSITLSNPQYRFLALFLLTAGITLKGLINGSRGAWFILITVLVTVITTVQFEQWQYVLYLPPILLPALIASIFIRSLLPNKKPLITLIAESAKRPLNTDMLKYTRTITIVWATLLSVMTLWAIFLPFTAPPWVWSIFTNFLNYIFIAALFVGEYIYRKYRFTNQDFPNLLEHIKIVLDSFR